MSKNTTNCIDLPPVVRTTSDEIGNYHQIYFGGFEQVFWNEMSDAQRKHPCKNPHHFAFDAIGL